MLWIYRRHEKSCSHRRDGRKYQRCGCPLWVDGRLRGARLHKSLGTRDRQVALGLLQRWETAGRPPTTNPEPRTLEQSWSRFLADMIARNLHASTLRKYRLL